ncbi:MAG: MBL fold metallo-hydrolase [Candidatus Marinimicrobia bacterium]|nr:MBL fold metallo-hydrolase [Candidatus Neomarinimicrobiota bacterium]
MKIKFTGTGDGRGIPAVGCQCQRCSLAREKGSKNRRRTVSVIVTNKSDTILFDAPSSIGRVLNEEKIFHLSAIFLSHKHFDHIGGITVFEYWPEKILVYGNMSVLGNFEITDRLYNNCEFHVLHEKKSVKINNIRVKPFSVSHKVPTFGLIFKEDEKRIVHFSDKAGTILDDYEKRLVKISDIVVFHTPGFDGGTDHIDVVSVMDIAKRNPSTRFVITHIGHNNLSHEELVKKLKPYENIIVAYDGLELEV